MKNKGFTLVELIGVIVILGVVAIFAVPALTKTLKDSAEKSYNEYVRDISIAAENYFHNETDEIINGKYFISVGTLIEKGYLKRGINPKTNEETSDNATVIITKNTDKTEKYQFVETDVTENGYVKDGLVLQYDGYKHPENGIWYDLSGNNNNGTLNNFDSSYGIDVNGIKFDGIDDFIMVNRNSDFPSGNENYTMEISIYYYELKNRNNLINLGIYNSPGNANGIYIGAYKKISHWYWSNDLLTDNLLDENKKYVITAQYDGSNRNIYLNGVKVASDESVPNVILGNITIGDEIPGQDGFFNGKVFSVRIYNRALTDKEIYNNYNVDKYRFDV